MSHNLSITSKVSSGVLVLVFAACGEVKPKQPFSQTSTTQEIKTAQEPPLAVAATPATKPIVTSSVLETIAEKSQKPNLAACFLMPAESCISCCESFFDPQKPEWEACAANCVSNVQDQTFIH